jgi:cytochrome c
MGKDLWSDTDLSTNGLSCQTCHQGNQNFGATFAEPYPHEVAMATDRAGLGEITAEEMVQLCMVVPMQAEPLPWDSRELAALAAYTTEVQKSFNPCAAGNPCNPCAA